MSPVGQERPGLCERLEQGAILCAQGYLFELERRGYLQAGAFVPEVVLEHPEQVTAVHRDFVHAGSDVVEALTYYAHRDKLRAVGREGQLEALNRAALGLAADVARDTGALLAGNVCNTNRYDPSAAGHAAVRAMFEEQLDWAVEAGVDYVIGETFRYLGEAELALEAIQDTGLPAVITLAVGREPLTRDGAEVPEACRRLAEQGATVVGLNCLRGPATMLPLLAGVTAAVDVPVASLPVPYRTTDDQPTFQSLSEPGDDRLPHGRSFPTALDPFTCHRYQIADFTRAARAAGVAYLGLCCGAGPHHVRSMAEALGRTPPASRYSEDMSRHVYLGEIASAGDRDYRDQL